MIATQAAVAFLDEAARFFERRPINGEDAAHWSNVANAENCRQIAELVRSLSSEAQSPSQDGVRAISAPDDPSSLSSEEAQNVRLREEVIRALEPLAETPIPPNVKPHWPINYNCVRATYRDVERARALIATLKDTPNEG